ncbi:MAG: lytic transglycosylase domain-containing protein [Pseudomonadota bacterium]
MMKQAGVRHQLPYVFLLLLCGPGVILAESLDQQFKRITVQELDTGNRINVQISPQDTPEAVPETDPFENPTPTAVFEIDEDEMTAAWFWRRVSPALEDASRDALERAASVVAEEGRLSVASHSEIDTLIRQYGAHLLAAGAETGTSPALLLSIMYVESRGNRTAVSPAGAQGVMQLIPATASRFDVDDPFDPGPAILGAAQYLRFLLDEFAGDAVLALAGYNAGENAVLQNGRVPPYKETRAYVPKVIATWIVASEFCSSQQTLATDGCVFANLR